jgi:hypothetical protein
VQQNFISLNAIRALLQAITDPSGPLTVKLGSQTVFTLAAQLADLQPGGPAFGVTELNWDVKAINEADSIKIKKDQIIRKI